MPRHGARGALRRGARPAGEVHLRPERAAQRPAPARRPARRVRAPRRSRRPLPRGRRRSGWGRPAAVMTARRAGAAGAPFDTESVAGRGFQTRSLAAPIPAEQLTIVPANEASWQDLEAIFGTADYPGRCRCQALKIKGWIWRDSRQDERTAMLREQTACGDRNAVATSGLVAYLDDEPVGWVAVEPRTAYPKLRTTKIPWTGRD